MQFLDQDAIPENQITQTFQNASWRSLLWVVLIMGVITAYVAIPKGQATNPVLIAVPAFATLFFTGLLLWHLRLCLNSRNWLIKAGENGLFINLQSNVHTPPTPDVPPVLFVQKDEIDHIRRVQEVRTLPDRNGQYRNTFAYFDLTLTKPLPEELLVALARIRRNPKLRGDAGFRKDLYGAVRVENQHTLRLQWDWMSPRELTAETWFASQYPVEEHRRFKGPGWDKMDSEARNAYIDTLWEWGDVQDAVHLKSLSDTISERHAARDLSDRLG